MTGNEPPPLPAWLTDDYYQPWLRNGLLSSRFPWQDAQRTTLHRFLERYTLHDSILVGLWVPPTSLAVMVIRWELAWNEGVDVPLDEEEVRNDEARYAVPFWPVLIFGFSDLVQAVAHFDQSGEDPTSQFIKEAASGPVEEGAAAPAREAPERVAWPGGDVPRLRSAPLHQTRLVGPSGAFLCLLHAPSVSLLAMTRAGEVLTLPNL